MKKYLYFLVICITIFLLPRCAFLNKLEAHVIISDWKQECDDFDSNCGRVNIYYMIQNTGNRGFDYYSVLFRVICKDGSHYKEWDNGDHVDEGKTINDFIAIDTEGKKADSVVVEDVILDFPPLSGKYGN